MADTHTHTHTNARTTAAHARDDEARHASFAAEDPSDSPLLSLNGEGDASKTRRRGWCASLAAWASSAHVSLYWMEKAILILQYGQLWALFWAYARPWPLPFVLRNQTRWVVWFNLDIPSALTYIEDDSVVPVLRGSTYGTFTHYWLISVAWAALPGLLALGYWLLLRYAWLRYWDMRAIRIWAQDGLLLLAHLIYLPALLALSRTYVCETHPLYEGYRLAVDPELQCFNYQHFVLALACLPSTVFLWLGVPLFMIWRIREHIVFERRFEHERYLRWKEAEYVHDLSYDWRRGHFWLFSSFQRTALHAYDRPAWMLSMSILVLVFCYSRRSPAVMADMMFAVLVLWQLRQVIFPGFRCGTTNVLASTIYTGMCIVVFWGLMRAHAMNNQFTVDSTFTLAQRGMNAGLLAAIVLVLAISCIPSFGWPRGYIGPHLWRKLLAEEQAEEERERGFDGMELPGGLPRPRMASRRGARTRNPVAAFWHSMRDRWSAMLHRRQERAELVRAPASPAVASPPSTFPSTMALAQDAVPSSTALQGGSPGGNHVFFAPTPAAAAISARRAPKAWGSQTPSASQSGILPGAAGGANAALVESSAALTREMDAANAHFQELEAQQTGLVASERAEDDAASAYDVPASARRASEVPDVSSSDFDALLLAREREYELREYYGDDVADQVLLKQKQSEFTWEGTRDVEMATGFASGRATAHPHSDGHSGGMVRFNTASAPFVDATRPAGTVQHNDGGQDASDGHGTRTSSRFRRHVANSATVQLVRPAESMEDASSLDSSAQARSLTPAEVSALEAVWVATIKTARTCLKANALVPAEIVNVPLLRRWVKVLRREHRRAHRCRHVLAWSLEETLDDMSALADACQSRTLFPNPVLETLLRDLKTRLDRREREYALTSTKRRRVITKLFALATFMGPRHIARLHIPGVNDKYFLAALRGAGDTGSTESNDFSDALAAYAHIVSIFRDVLPLEVSMMGVRDLKELITDVLSQRLIVDVLRLAKQHDWALPRRAFAPPHRPPREVPRGSVGTPGGASSIVTDSSGTGAVDSTPLDGPLLADVSLLDNPVYDFPMDGLPEESREMLVAVYDRVHELLQQARGASHGTPRTSDASSATLRARETMPTDLLLVIEPWMCRFAPLDARDRGLPAWVPGYTASVVHAGRAPEESDIEQADMEPVSSFMDSDAHELLGPTPSPGLRASPVDTERSSAASNTSRLSSRAHEVTGSMLFANDRRLVGSAMSNMRPDTSMSTVSAVRPFSASMLSSRAGGASAMDGGRMSVDVGNRHRAFGSEHELLSPIHEAPLSIVHDTSMASLGLGSQPGGSSRGFGTSRMSGRVQNQEETEVAKWDPDDISVDATGSTPTRAGAQSGASVRSGSRSRGHPIVPDLRLRPVFEEHQSAAHVAYESGDTEGGKMDAEVSL